MNGIEKLARIKAFESDHDVTRYVADGWHVWPLVRVSLGFSSFSPKPLKGWRRQWRMHLRPALGYLRGKYRQVVKGSAFDGACLRSPAVVFLTTSERRVWRGGSYYEIYSDPIVEKLRNMGKDAAVWEIGGTRTPQYSPSHNISSALVDQFCLLSARPRRLQQPDWFEELQPLFLEFTGRDVLWEEMALHIVAVSDRSKIFERWLREANPQVLIAVCWYGVRSMAATLAARRLGIKVVDLQHGVQGEGHFAYAGWHRFPEGGYEVMPDVFWVWGDIAARDLRAQNPELSKHARFVVGGNAWLNQWRTGTHSSGLNLPADRRVLVTLQRDISPLVLEAIRHSPVGWRWMIRFHPSRSSRDRKMDRAQLLSTGHAGIELDGLSEMNLYELLRRCDVHLTESSTCALEALAFQVRTIISTDTPLGRIGKAYYRSYIESGAMHVADTPADLLNLVRNATPLSESSSLATDYFTDRCCSAEAMRQLLERA